MSFWSKVLNVATGGLSGMAKPLLHGDVKGALTGAVTGGLYSGAGQPQPGQPQMVGGMVGQGEPQAGQQMDPERLARMQEMFRSGMGAKVNGMNGMSDFRDRMQRAGPSRLQAGIQQAIQGPQQPQAPPEFSDPYELAKQQRIRGY